MSAFLLPDNHINALISFAKDRKNGYTLHTGNEKSYRLNDKATFNALGKLLRDANEASLRERYDRAFEEEITENPYISQFVYTGNLTEEDIINAVDCFHYQSCEYDGYKASDAYFVAEAIKAIAVSALIDGKDKVWVITDLEHPHR